MQLVEGWARAGPRVQAWRMGPTEDRVAGTRLGGNGAERTVGRGYMVHTANMYVCTVSMRM